MILSLNEIKERYPTHRRKIRVGIYAPDEIFDLVFEQREKGKRSLLIIGNLPGTKKYYGQEIRIRLSKFYSTYHAFRESRMCVKCGIRGVFIAAERDINSKGNNTSLFHFNFYAINDAGKQILMTRDHIIPSVYGGPNLPWNYQTMCLPCNEKRAHTGNIPYAIMNKFIKYIKFQTTRMGQKQIMKEVII